jgi:hypothetical protein
MEVLSQHLPSKRPSALTTFYDGIRRNGGKDPHILSSAYIKVRDYFHVKTMYKHPCLLVTACAGPTLPADIKRCATPIDQLFITHFSN